ncbi:MAG: hypothetical protein V3S03_08505 [Vicinamibacteria bacterium]
MSLDERRIDEAYRWLWELVRAHPEGHAEPMLTLELLRIAYWDRAGHPPCDRCEGPLEPLRSHQVNWRSTRWFGSPGLPETAHLCGRCYAGALFVSILVGFDLEELTS